jgi:hypothetical protein
MKSIEDDLMLRMNHLHSIDSNLISFCMYWQNIFKNYCYMSESKMKMVHV